LFNFFYIFELIRHTIGEKIRGSAKLIQGGNCIHIAEPHQSVREEIALEDLSPPPYCGAPLLEETHAGEWHSM
jgi:hypothetical protein